MSWRRRLFYGSAFGVGFFLAGHLDHWRLFKPTPIVVPTLAAPSCTLGVALEGVGTLRWRENVVVCKGPSGEPIVLSNMVEIKAQ